MQQAEFQTDETPRQPNERGVVEVINNAGDVHNARLYQPNVPHGEKIACESVTAFVCVSPSNAELVQA
jgi:hypothetical protein